MKSVSITKLKFFERDSVTQENYEYTGFYETLVRLKETNSAMWNSEAGGKMELLDTNRYSTVFAFLCLKDNNKIVVLLNSSGKSTKLKIK